VVHPQAVRAHRSNLAEFFQSVAANATQTSAGTSRSQATARTGATSFVQLHSQVDLSQHGDAAPDAMNATTTAAQTSKQVQPTPNDTTPTTTAGPNTTTAATTTPVPATTTPPRPATTSTPTTPKPTTLSAAAQKAKSKADAENAAAEAIFFKSLDNLGNRALQVCHWPRSFATFSSAEWCLTCAFVPFCVPGNPAKCSARPSRVSSYCCVTKREVLEFVV